VLGPGVRTHAQLMVATGKPYGAVVLEVERLMQHRLIYARNVGGERCHFRAGEPSLGRPARAEVIF
jgi:hypothetical protein